MNSLRIKNFAFPKQPKKLSGQFATWELERGKSYNDYNISIRFDCALISANRFSYASSDPVALDGVPKPLACHNPHFASTAPNRVYIHGHVFVRFSCPGSKNAFEFVLLSQPSVSWKTKLFHLRTAGVSRSHSNGRGPFAFYC